MRQLKLYASDDVVTDSQDKQLFDAILANQNHVLYQLLPPLSDASQRYVVRPRAHNRQSVTRLLVSPSSV